jgi:hypothetical protein
MKSKYSTTLCLAGLAAEHNKLRERSSALLDWNNKDAVAAKKEIKRLDGAIKACHGAIREITFGDLKCDDPVRNIRQWFDQREEEAEQREQEADKVVLVVEEKKERAAC